MYYFQKSHFFGNDDNLKSCAEIAGRSIMRNFRKVGATFVLRAKMVDRDKKIEKKVNEMPKSAC